MLIDILFSKESVGGGGLSSISTFLACHSSICPFSNSAAKEILIHANQ